MSKLTKWFSGKQKPWEPGVYERKWDGGNVNSDYWDGHQWFLPKSLPWRGLKSKSGAGEKG